MLNDTEDAFGVTAAGAGSGEVIQLSRLTAGLDVLRRFFRIIR